jgi:LuxR family maltose regulon positive regulatory protein
VVLHRKRLVARLEDARSDGLTLLSAPPGYGKTTLVVDWLRRRTPGRQVVAWLSLDAGDNDPVQFARLLVAALRAATRETGATLLASIRSREHPPLRKVCTTLINDLVASPREVIVVLDDYHVIWQPAIHEAVVFLLKHLPPRLRIVVLTRGDPPFPLVQLRAGRALCELRAADLRFTVDEVAAFLRELMDLPVTAAEAAALEARTEGWIASLQLAALSLPATCASGFMAAFGENKRIILDYLTAEVLAHQPPPIQTFLMRTSVLNRLSGPLCEAVLGDEWPEGQVQAFLEQIERANLFLIPLDREGRWYRYHHLFADLLRARLGRVEPELTLALHRRASSWYEAHGFAQEAIRHALAAPDLDHATRLIELHGMTVFYLGQLQTILDWFQALPAEAASSRPLLCIIHAYALCGSNQLEAAARCLQETERLLGSGLLPGVARGIEGDITLLRSLIASARGDLALSIALAVRAADLLPVSVPGLAFARVWAERAYKVSGVVTPKSERALAAAVEKAQAARVPVAVRVGLIHLAQMHMLQGRLSRATAVLAKTEKALGLDVAFTAPGYYFGRAHLLWERNDLDGADHFLAQGMEAISEANIVMPYTAAAGYYTLALLRQARGDGRGAIAAVDGLVALARRRELGAAVLTRAAAIRARLWLMQDNLAAAAHWADTSGPSPNDQLGFPREVEYLVLARVLIATVSEAAPLLLDKMLRDAEDHGRLRSAIEILALRALGCQALGDKDRALQDLERALALAEPEGYVRVFVDEGAPMATLLRRARTLGIAPEYTTMLLTAFGDRTDANTHGAALPSPELTVAARAGAPSPVAQPLSARERDVLQLVVGGASNEEIAKRLFLSRGTVKKHVHHIFGKLDVKSRAQLIAMVNTLSMDRPQPP